MYIRQEQPEDRDAIGAIIVAAFADHPHSQQNEHRIVLALRVAGVLTVSLVAIVEGEIAGHIACSPVSVNGDAGNWFGLGPVAVHPSRQNRGIGAALVQASILALTKRHAGGIVLLGDPKYYRRFGFATHPSLVLPGVPLSHFLCLSLSESIPVGTVAYHSAFAP